MVKPLVTVYIPTHNRPEMLARALASVTAQDYPAVEIIVVDDGSLLANREENRLLCARYNNVQLIEVETSVGACAARNIAINMATGEFITGLDDDDEFCPGRISAFVATWQRYPHVSLLATGYQFILPGGKKISSGRRARWVTADRIKHINDFGNQVFTRTDYLRAINGFDPALVACQDYDVWIRLVMRFGKGYRIGLQNYIVHQEHDSPRISVFSKRLHGHQQLIDKHRHDFTAQQLRSQAFFRALYGGEKNLWYLAKLSGVRHGSVLLKMLLARTLSRRPTVSNN